MPVHTCIYMMVCRGEQQDDHDHQRADPGRVLPADLHLPPVRLQVCCTRLSLALCMYDVPIYLYRAKKIQNKTSINRNVIGDTGIHAVTGEIERLKKRLDERTMEFDRLR